MTTFIEGDDPKLDCRWLIVYAIIVAIFLAILCTSCTSTKYIPIIEREYVSSSDTITRYDSIFVSQIDTVLIKGDSVVAIKWRNEFRYIDRYRYVTDTIIRNDTISVPMPIESKLSWWQRVKIATWPYMLVVIFLVAFLLAWLIRKKSN